MSTDNKLADATTTPATAMAMAPATADHRSSEEPSMTPTFTTQSAREAFDEICERAVLSEKAMDALARLCRELAECSRLHKALVIAEAALADIGDADREPGDDVAWCEARAAKALPKVRAALKVTHNA